jgi:hypothetical protein
MCDGSHAFLKRPFFEHLSIDPNWSSVEAALDVAGIEWPTFKDDSGPKSITGTFEEDGTYERFPGSVGRAEIMVSAFLDAATELAGIVNRYKRKEISDRIHEIETSDLSNPDVRKHALADIIRLKQMLEQLDRQVRWGLPQWKVTGEQP